MVADNGIGMSEEELTGALGTIASSGTRAFLDRLASTNASEATGDLIGQFGIGFYSAFMVADHVEVDTRRAGSDHALRWTSDGKGSYAIAPLPLDTAPARGTRVVLHLNTESENFWSRTRSNASCGSIPAPSRFRSSCWKSRRGSAFAQRRHGALDASQEARSRLRNTRISTSRSASSTIPVLTVHWRAEGRHEYTVLAFVPGSRPFDLFDPSRKGKAKLYVRRVLISSDADILPNWLRFVRLVVDSADLPLNVSRELIQESAVFAAIKKGVANRIVQELAKFAETDKDAFDKVWENFGGVIKEGLYEDPEAAATRSTSWRASRPQRIPAASARSPTMSRISRRTRPRSTTCSARI